MHINSQMQTSEFVDVDLHLQSQAILINIFVSHYRSVAKAISQSGKKKEIAGKKKHVLM